MEKERAEKIRLKDLKEVETKEAETFLQTFSKSRGEVSKAKLVQHAQEIQQIQRKIEKMEQILANEKAALKRVCHHPAEYVTYKAWQEYYEDDYGSPIWSHYDTFEEMECELCGEKHILKKTIHRR